MTPILVACTFLTSVLANLKNNKDKSEQEMAVEIREAGLKELFEELPKNRKHCRYNFNSKLDINKICENEFDCTGCFTHRENRYRTFIHNQSNSTVNISGFSFEPTKFYHRGHLSTGIECCGLSRIGYSPLLKELVRDAVLIEPLRKNDIVEQNEIIAIFKTSNNVEIPLLSPISGEIVAANHLSENDSWLALVKPFDLRKELQNLLYGQEAINWFTYEMEDFMNTVAGDLEFAADGGEIDLSQIEHLPWKEIIFNFLMSGF